MSRQHVWQLAALGLVVYVVVLVATFPAMIAWRVAAPETVVAAGVRGSAWHGRADMALISEMRLVDLQWTLRPLELLRGRMGVRFDTRLDDGFVQGQLAVSASGQRMWMRDLQAAFPLQPLATAAGYRGVGGQLSIDLAHLTLIDEWPERVQGTIGIGQLVISDLGRESLGDFTLALEGEDARVLGQLSDRGGPVEVQATLRLEPDGSYELAGRVQARNEATQELRQIIEMLGAADASGMRQFGVGGRL